MEPNLATLPFSPLPQPRFLFYFNISLPLERYLSQRLLNESFASSFSTVSGATTSLTVVFDLRLNQPGSVAAEVAGGIAGTKVKTQKSLGA
jgi:hypothetical protein